MRKLKFITFAFIAIAIVSILGVLALVFIIDYTKHGTNPYVNGNPFEWVGYIGGIIGAFGLIIWIPLGIIAGNLSKKNGFKSALWFVGASICVISLVVGTCSGITF